MRLNNQTDSGMEVDSPLILEASLNFSFAAVGTIINVVALLRHLRLLLKHDGEVSCRLIRLSLHLIIANILGKIRELLPRL